MEWWWRAATSSYRSGVSTFAVLKETDHTVLFLDTRWREEGSEQRQKKVSDDYSWFKTRDEAYECAIQHCRRRRDMTQRTLDQWKGKLATLRRESDE